MSATGRPWRTRMWSNRSARWCKAQKRSPRANNCRRTSRSSARMNVERRRTGGPVLQLDLGADFEHLVRRDLEERRRPQGVARHEREQFRAPLGDAGPLGGDEGLTAQEECRSLDPNVEGFRPAGCQDVLDVGIVHESVAG